jgi:hypothetical protein
VQNSRALALWLGLLLNRLLDATDSNTDGNRSASDMPPEKEGGGEEEKRLSELSSGRFRYFSTLSNTHQWEVEADPGDGSVKSARIHESQGRELASRSKGPAGPRLVESS